MEQTNPKHLKYYVDEIKSNTMIVSRVNDKYSFTAPVLRLKVGSPIILFEKAKDQLTGKPRFECSVLNYKVDRTEPFWIHEVRDKHVIISGKYGEKHAVPLYYVDVNSKDANYLQIKELDKINNTILFHEPQQVRKDFSKYEPNKLYTFPVIEDNFNNSKRYLRVQDDKQVFTITLNQFFKDVQLPESIECRFVSSDNFRGFNINLNFLKKIIYKDKTNNTITFKVVELLTSTSTGTVTWKLQDDYGIYHFYYPQSDFTLPQDHTIKEGDSIELNLLSISEVGNLKLQLKRSRKDTPRKKFEIKEVFTSIGFSNEETKYFFALSKEKVIIDLLNTNYIDQYNDDNNLWIFSYFYALDIWILHLIEEGDFEECKKVIAIYQAFEQWIIEESTFLEAFSEHKAQEAIKKGESKLESLAFLEEAISLIENDEDEELVSDVYNKLAQGKHVLSKRKNVFKELVRISQFINIDEDQDEFYKYVVVLIKNDLLDENDIIQFKRSIYKKLALEGNTIERLLNETSPEALLESEKLLTSFLKYQYLLCILSNKLGDESFTKAYSVNFLKILSKLKNDAAYVEFAIKLLATNAYLAFSANQIVDPNNLSIFELEKVVKNNPVNFYANKKGYVTSVNNMLTISPSFLLDKSGKEQPFTYEVITLSNLHLSIRTNKDIIPIDVDDITLELLDNINHILTNQTSIYYNDEDVVERITIISKDPKLSLSENHVLLKDLFMISKCLDLLIIQEKDINKEIAYAFIQFCVLRTLGNNRAYAFRDKIDNYRNQFTIEYLATEDPDVLIEKIKANDLPLNNIGGLVVTLFKHYDTNQIEIPIDVSFNAHLVTLKKLIESYNTFKIINWDSINLEDLRDLIIQNVITILSPPSQDNSIFKEILEDSINVEHEGLDESPSRIEEDNLGHETKNIEFKSSLFHSASDTPQEFVILKTICGFLNAYEGGVLYIGVNDNGNIIGLKDDLKVKPEIKTIDNLQNHLQRLIADEFPKEINAILDYRQRKSGDLDYLEIHIPTYEKVVVLQNKYYQRQGTQTRLLQGLDIQDLIMRKLSMHKNVPVFINALKENNHLNTSVGVFTPIEIDERERVDFYRDQKEEGEYDESNSLDYQEAISYLHIFENNSYMVSKRKDVPRSTYSIGLPAEFKNGYLLYCYDNACVNKVEVRTLLSKELNFNYKNGLSKEGKLVKLLLATNDDSILVSVKRNNIQYAKIYAVNKITTHRIVHLKGNCIVQEDYDKLEMFHLFEKEVPEQYKQYFKKSRTGYGNLIDETLIAQFSKTNL